MPDRQRLSVINFFDESSAGDSLESHGLFFLEGLVVHAQQVPIRRNLRKIDILSENMCPDIRRKLSEFRWDLSASLDGWWQAIDDFRRYRHDSQIEITRFCRDDDSSH